jgi:DNA mismatch repair protein MutL
MIRILPSDLVNQIAAGEVIERPASVIKELVENSIDASSTSVDVFVENGGQSYICVKDNGAGMTIGDLELCIQRHATSKLLGKNLLDIHTFGFRGEALPSICSISRVEIKSKTPNEDLGWLLGLDGGVEVKIEPIKLDAGTVVTVRDLFYKTPARLKFLKSSSSELAASGLQVKLLALSNHKVAFSFVSAGRRLFYYAASDTQLARLQDVMGADFCENGVAVQYDEEGITITGLASCPTYHKNGGQYLFVNNRPVKDRLLAGAIKVAYQRVLVPGEQPSYALFVSMEPQDVDVNVHPAKTEVRFRAPGRIRSAIITAVEQALLTTQRTATTFADKFMSSCQRDRDNFGWLDVQAYRSAAADCSNAQSSLQENGPSLSNGSEFSSLPYDNNVSPPHDVFLGGASSYTGSSSRGLPNAPHDSSNSPYSSLSLGTPKAQVFDSFIIAQNGNEMFLIDQHAAHERVVYEHLEQYLTLDAAGNVAWTGPTQRVMFPVYAELAAVTALNADEVHSFLCEIGFECELVSNNDQTMQVSIFAVPKICEALDVAGLVHDIIDDTLGHHDKSSLLEAVHKVFATYACHHSIRANHPLNDAEMNALLRQIEDTPRSGQCNHGRPTYVKLSRKDLERLFERAG